MNFLWKKEKLQNRKNCILTKNTFYPISPVLINLQTCTIPNFKGNFIINDSFYIMDESQWLPALLEKKVSVYFFSWHPLFLILFSFLCMKNMGGSSWPSWPRLPPFLFNMYSRHNSTAVEASMNGSLKSSLHSLGMLFEEFTHWMKPVKSRNLNLGQWVLLFLFKKFFIMKDTWMNVGEI